MSHNRNIGFFKKEVINTEYLEIRNYDHLQQPKQKVEYGESLEGRNPAKHVYGGEEINTNYIELPSLVQLEKRVHGKSRVFKSETVLEEYPPLSDIVREERRAIIAKEKLKEITDLWSAYIAKPSHNIQMCDEGYDSSEEDDDKTPEMSPVNTKANSPRKTSDEAEEKEIKIDCIVEERKPGLKS